MLLNNGIDFSAVDEAGNNALHVAVREGNVRTARVLLTESRSEFRKPQVNKKNVTAGNFLNSKYFI